MSDDAVRLPLVDLSGYKVPDFSHCKRGSPVIPAWGSPEYDKYMADLLVHEDVVDRAEKALVFADKAHESKYDSALREYRESLMEDEVEPETVEKCADEPDKRFKLVGQGFSTDDKCGMFLRFMACSDPEENHNFSTLEGGNFSGKGFVHPQFSWCHKPSCCVCYARGWAFREALIIEARMKAIEFGYVDDKGVRHAGLGRAEHIIVSVPQSDYGLSYEKLKAKALKIIFSRGIIGGVMIWHPKRYRKFDVFRGGIRNMRGWYFACHWHVIGYFASGVNYAKCRNCPKMKPYEMVTGSGRVVRSIGNADVCKGCDGFECKVRVMAWGSNLKPNADGSAGFYVDSKGRQIQGDKYIVKVAEYRKSILGTAWYQLNHSGYMIGAKHFSPQTWFGTMSYRKLSVTIERKKQLCGICNNDLIPHKYVGKALYERFEGLPNRNEVLDMVEFDAEGNAFNAWVIDKAEVDNLAKKQSFR